MRTLDRYITAHANRSILAVLTVLLSLITLFALFEEMDESQVSYGLAEAAAYVLKTIPRRLDEIMVYGLFLGYLIALGRLAESNELTICRVSGMSPTRLCLALAPSMLMWMLISVVVSEYIAPTSERIAEVDKLSAKYGDDALGRRGGLWLRDQQMFMRVRAIDEKGQIWGVDQYILDAENALEQSITAEMGYFDEAKQHWVLKNVNHSEFGPTGAAHKKSDEEIWQNSISPELLAAQAFLAPTKMSTTALWRQIKFAKSQQLGVSEYELAFWSRILKPLTYLGLTLFALAVVIGPLREVGMGLRLTVGIFGGLGFKYLQDLFAPAAIVFNIPAVIAILIPIALYWTIAIVLIRKNA